MCFQVKGTGVPHLVYARVFSVKVNQINCFLYRTPPLPPFQAPTPRILIWWNRIFFMPTEFDLFRCENLPKTFDLGSTYNKPWFWSNPLSISKYFFMFWGSKFEKIRFVSNNDLTMINMFYETHLQNKGII